MEEDEETEASKVVDSSEYSEAIKLSTYFEPYGTVHPWSSRLLKILPDGFPVYEPVSLEEDLNEKDFLGCDDDKISDDTAVKESHPMPTATATEELEGFNLQLLKIERKMKSITGSLDVLRGEAEKFFIVMDAEVRQAQMKQDPLFKNRDKWISCDLKKGEALRELVNLQDLFRLANLTTFSSTKQKGLTPPQLSFLSSITSTSPESLFTALAVAIAKRWRLCLPLLNMIEMKKSQIQVALIHQKRFLRIVDEIKNVWNLQKIPYAPHVYEKGDDYPYRAEVRVELFNIPATCWGYDRPRRWVLPLHATPSFNNTVEPLGQPTPAPFLCWPPLPSVPPTASAIGEVFFIAPYNKQSSDDDSLGIQIRWVGDASHCIESRSLLNVQIVPVALRLCGKKKDTPVCAEHLSNTTLLINDSSLKLTASQQASEASDAPTFAKSIPSPLLPQPKGIQSTWAPESIELHQRLQAAQWHLVDRAVHLIYQAQAARLKNILDVVAYGTSDDAVTATCILEEFEGFRNKLPVRLPTKQCYPSRNNNSSQNIDGSGLILLPRHLTVERWEAHSTSITIQNIPIYAPCRQTFEKFDKESNSPQSDVSCATDPYPLFTVDVEIWVNYAPSSCKQLHNKNNETLSSLISDSTVSTTELYCLQEFIRRLPMLEALSVCFLRNELLQAWRSSIRDLPRECFDLHYLTLASTRQARGGKLFVNFVDWIQTYLVTKMVHRNSTYSSFTQSDGSFTQ